MPRTILDSAAPAARRPASRSSIGSWAQRRNSATTCRPADEGRDGPLLLPDQAQELHPARIPLPHRVRRPSGAASGLQPQGAFEADRIWLPFGSPRVDLSGFWFRPTVHRHLGATPASMRPQPARRRSGCAPAAAPILFVNGSEVGWMAPYGRNLEAAEDFAVELKAGAQRASASGSTISPSATPAISSSSTICPARRQARAADPREERHRRRDGGGARRRCISSARPMTAARWRL